MTVTLDLSGLCYIFLKFNSCSRASCFTEYLLYDNVLSKGLVQSPPAYTRHINFACSCLPSYSLCVSFHQIEVLYLWRNMLQSTLDWNHGLRWHEDTRDSFYFSSTMQGLAQWSFNGCLKCEMPQESLRLISKIHVIFLQERKPLTFVTFYVLWILNNIS